VQLAAKKELLATTTPSSCWAYANHLKLLSSKAKNCNDKNVVAVTNYISRRVLELHDKEMLLEEREMDTQIEVLKRVSELL